MKQNKEEIKKVLVDMGITGRNSYSVEHAKKVFKACNVDFDKKLIHTEDKYREQSTGAPRVDGLVIIRTICEKHDIKPNPDKMDLAGKMIGEGSRRGLITAGYLGEGSEWGKD